MSRSVSEEGGDWAAPRCGRIHTSCTELLAACFPARRLESQHLDQSANRVVGVSTNIFRTTPFIRTQEALV